MPIEFRRKEKRDGGREKWVRQIAAHIVESELSLKPSYNLVAVWH